MIDGEQAGEGTGTEAKSKPIIGPCLVCGEPSSGKHYGVISCLGCKTFFRRAVVQQASKDCQRNGVCSTEDTTKKMCRSCRYRRCLEMGMKIEALQPRRDLIGIRRYQRKIPRHGDKENGEHQRCGSSGSSPSSSTDPAELLDLMHRLTRIDMFIRDQKAEWIRADEDARRLSRDRATREEDANKADIAHRIVLSADVSTVTQFDMQAMLEWANSLPVFASLTAAEKVALLRRFAMLCMILEHGYYTAKSGAEDVWLMSNGSCMPRNIAMLADNVEIPEDRKWRQEKLYKQMTECCIDEVVNPLRYLQLLPEELVTLKVIMLFQCGSPHCDGELKLSYEELSDLSDETRKRCAIFRNQVIAALFKHYENVSYENFSERFGNVILMISGISSAATAMLESYQIMRLFNIVNFDKISTQLLFNSGV